MAMQILLPLALLAAAPGQHPAPVAPERDATEIVKRAQALFDGLAPGDVALWRDALTEDAVLIDEFGRRQTKAEALREMRPLPAGFSGSIEVRSPTVHFYPATAILDCEMFEQEKVFEQQLTVRYLATLVFVHRGRDWKLAAMETVTLPTPPPRLEVSDLPVSDYPGTYTYGPGRRFIVEVGGRELKFRTRPDGRATPLEPLAKDVFMDAGEERNLILFRRDERGRVTSLVQRRKFNDLHMRRVEEPALDAAGARAQPVPGSMDVRWSEGAEDCAATPQPPLQVHAYEPRTFILRQSLCADPEGNFLYLLIGSRRALLIDSGAVADGTKMPLAKTVSDLLPDRDGSKLPLLVVHTHRHLDHRAGDPQFASLPFARVVAKDVKSVREFFGFDDWPNGLAHVDLGDRTIDVLPAPGHNPAHLVFYDDRTGLLFTGDFLLPGRLVVEDTAADKESARRVVAFAKTHPVRHVLGGHIEVDVDGETYGQRSTHHPREHPLELSTNDLLALPAALDDFNGFYTRRGNLILTNPIHLLEALATGTAAVLVLAGFGLRALLRRRRLGAPARG